jgi:hypothetical protein
MGIKFLNLLEGGFKDGRFNIGYVNFTLKVNLQLLKVNSISSKLYSKQLQMVSTLIINCTNVMKEHNMGNCFHTTL